MRHLLPSVAISLGLFSSQVIALQPAHAFRILDVQAAQAQGLNGAPISTIELPRGHSVNISFIESGQTIQSIWLDDPAHVVFNTDSPLCEFNSGNQGNCGGASIIRVRRLDTAIDFPDNASNDFVQANGVRSTLLTVIATDSQSRRFMYQFVLQLVPRGTAPYTAIRIVPGSTRPPGVVIQQAQNRLTQIRRGLQVAQQQNLIDTSSPEWPRLQQFLSLAGSGELSLEEAVTQSGVSRQFINRLASIGSR